ncbi:MAG: NF038122 family metalloprotease [Xenococcus sp. MO_188.B8]|nr:NF038122 family metalloprotease [Xenococcus sp. MO_188.B8]
MSEVGGVDFNFSFAPGVLDEQILGFEVAGNIWSQYLHDTYKGEDLDINIYVAVGDDILPDDVAGGAFPAIETDIRYKKIYKALKKDITTTTDEIAVDSLLGTKKYDVLVGENIIDGNKKMQATRANLKALGMIKKKDFDQLDGFIVMNSLVNNDSISWNYNYLEEPQEGELDFLSVALHEIGHNLGFASGVDLENWNEQSEDFDGERISHVTTIDLFRYSLESSELNINDLTFGKAAYFSIDGTVKNGIALSNGADYQASHWINGDLETGLGIMNPTIRVGERWEISKNDLTVFDAIGWDVDYDAEVELEDLVEDKVEELYGIDLEDLVEDAVEHLYDMDDAKNIELDALFNNTQLRINNAYIVDRSSEVDEIFSGEAYHWASRSSGSSTGGWWWASRSSGSSTGGWWWASRSSGSSTGGWWATGYWSIYDTDTLSDDTSSNDNLNGYDPSSLEDIWDDSVLDQDISDDSVFYEDLDDD